MCKKHNMGAYLSHSAHYDIPTDIIASIAIACGHVHTRGMCAWLSVNKKHRATRSRNDVAAIYYELKRRYECKWLDRNGLQPEDLTIRCVKHSPKSILNVKNVTMPICEAMIDAQPYAIEYICVSEVVRSHITHAQYIDLWKRTLQKCPSTMNLCPTDVALSEEDFDQLADVFAMYAREPVAGLLTGHGIANKRFYARKRRVENMRWLAASISTIAASAYMLQREKMTDPPKWIWIPDVISVVVLTFGAPLIA